MIMPEPEWKTKVCHLTLQRADTNSAAYCIGSACGAWNTHDQRHPQRDRQLEWTRPEYARRVSQPERPSEVPEDARWQPAEHMGDGEWFEGAWVESIEAYDVRCPLGEPYQVGACGLVSPR